MLLAFTVFPVTVEIAQLPGRIEGGQASIGISIPFIPFADLLVGTRFADG